MHYNILLHDNKSIQQTVFVKQQQNKNSLVVENKSILIYGRSCVHPGKKFKVLIAYFLQINQQDESFSLITIIKRNKTKTLFSVFLLKIFFSHKEIRY